MLRAKSPPTCSSLININIWAFLISSLKVQFTQKFNFSHYLLLLMTKMFSLPLNYC